MSTAGKVLIVLIVLALLGWMFLAALVADHHMQWSRRYATLKAESQELAASIPPLRAEKLQTMEEASGLQVSLDRIRKNFRADLARAQKVESDTKETLSRYEIQNKTTAEEVTAAQARAQVRFQERQELERQIAEVQANVAQMKTENKALKDELASLRKAFMNTVAENKQYIEQLSKKKAPAASGEARTRLGSFVR